MLKKIVTLLENGDLLFRCKVLISFHTLVYLGMFFLGFILNQQNGFGNTSCLPCLDDGTTKMLGSFQHQGSSLFYPDSVYLDLRTSLLKIWEMGCSPHITHLDAASRPRKQLAGAYTVHGDGVFSHLNH